MFQSSQRSPARFRSFSQPQFSDGLMSSPAGSQPSNVYAPYNTLASQPAPGYASNAVAAARPLIPRRRLLQPSPPQPQSFSQQGLPSSQVPAYAKSNGLPPIVQTKVTGPRNLQFISGIKLGQQNSPATNVSPHSPQQHLSSSQMQSGVRLDSTQQTHYQHSRLGIHTTTQAFGSQETPHPAGGPQDSPHLSPPQINQQQ